MAIFNSKHITPTQHKVFTVELVGRAGEAREGQVFRWRGIAASARSAAASARELHPRCDLAWLTVERVPAGSAENNRPSAVLAAFRDYCTEATAAEVQRAAQRWHEAIASGRAGDTEAGALALNVPATLAEFTHARRVLRLLAGR